MASGNIYNIRISSIKILGNLICVFVALFFYIVAPAVYNFEFNVTMMVAFIIFNLIGGVSGLFKEKASFEFFFMIAFFMTNFVYPVFYFLDNRFVGFFLFPFNYNIISKATALALLAYACYMLTVVDYKNKKPVEFFSSKINPNLYKMVLLISFFSFIGFIVTGGITYLKNIYGEQSVAWGTIGFYSYFMLIFSYCNTILIPFTWMLNNKILKYTSLGFFLVIIFIFIAAGSRMLVVSMLLSLLISYNFFIKRIPLLLVSILIIMSAIFLFFISIIRLMGDNVNIDVAKSQLSESSSIFDAFMDLIINNRNLYVLVDYVDSHGSVFFANLIPKVLEVFPFSAKLMDLIGIPYFIRNDFPTFLEFGNNSSGLGLGSNMVGEAYLAFGVYGVVFIFLMLGCVIKFVKFRAVHSSYFLIIFFIIASVSVLFTRIPPILSFKMIFWPVFLFYIINLIFKKIAKTF